MARPRSYLYCHDLRIQPLVPRKALPNQNSSRDVLCKYHIILAKKKLENYKLIHYRFLQ